MVQLLSEIKSRHGLDFEIVEIRKTRDQYGERVDEGHEREIYEKDFKPRARILKQRVGLPLSDALRSKSGHYYLAGIIAIIRNDNVEWYTNYGQTFESYDKDNAVGFLRAVLQQGPSSIQDLCRETEGVSVLETKILDRFIASGVLAGDFGREIKVGRKVFTETVRGREATFDYRKAADAVCKSDTETWVLEVKRQLNYEALGAVLVYRHLYKSEHSAEVVRAGIVCESIDEEIASTCNELNVKVFRV